MLDFAAITYHQLIDRSTELQPYLESAIGGRHPPVVVNPSEELSDVLRGIYQGRLIPIVVMDDEMVIGLMVLSQTPETVHIRLLAGSMPKGYIRAMNDMVHMIAREYGKKRVQLIGRKGWKKLLKPFGYKPDGNYLSAEVAQ